MWIARELFESTPQALSADYFYRVNPVVSEDRTAIRSDQTLATPAPNVGGYPYILSPECESSPPPGP